MKNSLHNISLLTQAEKELPIELLAITAQTALRESVICPGTPDWQRHPGLHSTNQIRLLIFQASLVLLNSRWTFGNRA